MSNWQFETGIPIPPVNTRHTGAYRSKYMFLTELNVGQSVFIPSHKFKPQLVNQAVNRFAKKLDRKFVTRRRTEHNRDGIRVWRTR